MSAIRGRKALLAHLKSGGKIVSTHPNAELNDEQFVDPQSGAVVFRNVVHFARKKNWLLPCGDGLFGDSQTFRGNPKEIGLINEIRG